jgi:hypothetical protein
MGQILKTLQIAKLFIPQALRLYLMQPVVK